MKFRAIWALPLLGLVLYQCNISPERVHENELTFTVDGNTFTASNTEPFNSYWYAPVFDTLTLVAGGFVTSVGPSIELEMVLPGQVGTYTATSGVDSLHQNQIGSLTLKVGEAGNRQVWEATNVAVNITQFRTTASQILLLEADFSGSVRDTINQQTTTTSNGRLRIVQEN